MSNSYLHIIVPCYLILIPTYGWASPCVPYKICAFDFTHNLSYAHIMVVSSHMGFSRSFLPFWHLLPMGEKFRGFSGGLVVDVIHAYLSVLYMFMAWMSYVYRVNFNVVNICNEIQVHSHVHILWGSFLYILWFY